jgi:hypothetical protein
LRKDLGTVKDQTAIVAAGMDKMQRSTSAADEAAKKKSKTLEALGRVTGAAERGFNALTGTVMGFVRAGLAGTVQGAALEMRWRFLSREVANVFMPTIETAIDMIGQATNWFRNLSGTQQDNIRKWVLWGAATLGVVAALPKVVSAGKAVISTFQAMGAAGSMFALVAVGIAVVAREIWKLNEGLEESEKRINAMKHFGVTKKEFEKNEFAQGAVNGDMAKDKKIAMVKQEIEDMERMQNEITAKQQGRVLGAARGNIPDMVKFAGSRLQGAWPEFLGGAAKGESKLEIEQKNKEEFARRQAAAQAALDKLEGRNPKFAPDPEEKKRHELSMMPTHGFADFTAKFQHAQMAASTTDDPAREAAKGIKDLNANVQVIADKLAKMPFPIVR